MTNLLKSSVARTRPKVRPGQKNPLLLHNGKGLDEDDPDNVSLDYLRNNPDIAKRLYEEAEALAEIKQAKAHGGYVKKYANGGGVRKVRR